MTFEIFKKTGELRDRQGDWDGDKGDEEEIHIDNCKVEKALVRIIIDTKLNEIVTAREYRLISTVVEDMIDDNGLFDELCYNYADELHEWAQEEYRE